MSEVQLPRYKPVDTEFELVVDMRNMYAMLGIQSRPILKIDIEGSEFRVIKAFCMRPGIDKRLWPSQILMEFHDRLIAAESDEALFGRREAYECLRAAGYRLQYESSTKEEVLFALSIEKGRQSPHTKK